MMFVMSSSYFVLHNQQSPRNNFIMSTLSSSSSRQLPVGVPFNRNVFENNVLRRTKKHLDMIHGEMNQLMGRNDKDNDTNFCFSSDNYVTYFQTLIGSDTTDAKTILQYCADIASTPMDIFGLEVDGKPWDPHNDPPPKPYAKLIFAARKVMGMPLVEPSPTTSSTSSNSQKPPNKTSFTATSSSSQDKQTSSKEICSTNKTTSKPSLNPSTKPTSSSSLGKKRKATKKKSAKKDKKTRNRKPENMTSNNTNPYDGKQVCFDIDSDDGKYLQKCLHLEDWPERAIVTKKKKRYILGTVTEKNTKKQNSYKVHMNYTGIQPLYVDTEFIIRGVLLAERFKPRNKTLSKIRHKIFTESDELDDGDPICSDTEMYEDEDEAQDIQHDEDFILSGMQQDNIRLEDSSLYTEIKASSFSAEKIDGITWEQNKSIPEPSEKSCFGESKLKEQYAHHFDTVIDSFLAFLPHTIWEFIVAQSNLYAEQVREKNSNGYICGAPWKHDITLDEMMTFIGIHILMTLHPIPGRDIEYYFQNPDIYEFVKAIDSLRRFQQIRSVLHCNDNKYEGESKDELYKVRPLLNVLKNTLGYYLDVGDNIALDESSCATRSKYGRFLIFYNPTKPTGKYHFRFYFICDCTNYAILRVRVHTRNTTDLADGLNPNAEIKTTVVEEETKNEEENDGNESENEGCKEDEEEISKTNAIILDMVSPYFGSGRCLTMDNYYGGIIIIIKLKNNGLLVRCTFRMNRKHSCKFVQMKKSDAKKYNRGCYKMAVCTEFGIVEFGWLDGNPVHMLTTADGTAVSSVYRQIGRKRVPVKAPVAVPRYNNRMQAVDRIDQLMRLFALTKTHKLKKWYRQFMLSLIDMAIVNAEIHYYMKNPEQKKRKWHRYKFMEELGNQLINTDWQKYVSEKRAQEAKRSTDNMNNDSIISHLGITRFDETESRSSMESSSKSINADHCTPLVPKNYFTGCKMSDKRRICQICTFEGRGRKLQNVVFCAQHHVRACLEIHPDHTKENKYYNYSTSSYQPCYDWSWMCKNHTLSCWEKLHQYYIPKGLFTTPTVEISPDSYHSAHIKKSNCVYKQKQQALKLASMGVTETEITVPNAHGASDENNTSDDDSDSFDDDNV